MLLKKGIIHSLVADVVAIIIKMALTTQNAIADSTEVIPLKLSPYSKKAIAKLKKTYRIIFRIGMTVKEAVERVRAQVELIPEVVNFIEFIQSSQRGITR